MSTIEDDETDLSMSKTVNLDEPNSARPGPTVDSESVGKVVFLLKSVGGARVLKKKKWALPRSKTMGHIAEFLKKYMKLDVNEQQQLVLYVNQAFAPAQDTTLGAVNDCFNSEGTLVLHYALTQAWG
jgi:ubiquitin-like protein ATG12